MLNQVPFLQTSSDTLAAAAILVLALGLAGFAILFLFRKKKI